MSQTKDTEMYDKMHRTVSKMTTEELVQEYSFDYNRGYNLFSKKSVSAFLDAHEKVKKWKYEKFMIPFDLEKQSDPIRTWTEKDHDGQRVFRNGLQMEINLQILEIQV